MPLTPHSSELLSVQQAFVLQQNAKHCIKVKEDWCATKKKESQRGVRKIAGIL